MNRIIIKVIEGIRRIFRKQATPTNQAITMPVPEAVTKLSTKVPWPKKNYERYIRTRRIHIANNKEQLKGYNQEWHRLNAESVAKRKHEWYLSHKPEVKKYNSQWQTNHKSVGNNEEHGE